MTKWEYGAIIDKSANLFGSGLVWVHLQDAKKQKEVPIENVAANMAKLGEEGWELVGAFFNPLGAALGPTNTLYFKRPKQNVQSGG